eukprot:scaffold1219_cov23-Tisochrysis_lutea.AAC.2
MTILFTQLLSNAISGIVRFVDAPVLLMLIGVMQVLLGILDDGRVTDAKGRTVNFANTVSSHRGLQGHLLTSELTLLSICTQLLNGIRPRFMRGTLLAAHLGCPTGGVHKHPGLLEDQMTEVARLIVNELNKRLAAKNITLE